MCPQSGIFTKNNLFYFFYFIYIALWKEPAWLKRYNNELHSQNRWIDSIEFYLQQVDIPIKYVVNGILHDASGNCT